MKKVMVGMSGGVDSSVSALLLKENQYDVTGVTIKMFSAEDIENCHIINDKDDAEKIAHRLGFNHIVLNFREEFQKYVMEHFSKSYISGRTPNPCIECNKHIKFGKMLDSAKELGFDYIATGHYAITEYDEKSGRYLLKRSKDKSKDQTYVLYSLTQEQLSHTLFPLGNLTKQKVREIAEKEGFINSDKPDSQDICFIPDGDYVSFIRKFSNINIPEGNFIGTDGKILGKHKGIINYTIGQRKGLGISLGKPAYVVEKNIISNEIIIGDEADLYTNSLDICDVNLIPFDKLENPMKITAKTRYSQNEQEAVLSYSGNGIYHLEFSKPQRAVTSGQAAVFYDGDIVVGGGTIL